jgi:hypothetical protein
MNTERCPKCGEGHVRYIKTGDEGCFYARDRYKCGTTVFPDNCEIVESWQCLRNQLAAALARAEELEAKVKMVEELPEAYALRCCYDGWELFDPGDEDLPVYEGTTPWEALESMKEAYGKNWGSEIAERGDAE